MSNIIRYKYRLKFSKLGNIKFVGHLDLLNILHRTIKRANIPISYSQGFNPHQKTSFAIPLPLGMESTTEYVDIMLDEEVDTNLIKENLNSKMPVGMEIIEVKKLAENDNSSASSVYIGEYEVLFPTDLIELNDEFMSKLNEYLKQEEILIERISKKKGRNTVKQVDIRPEIFKIEVASTTKLNLRISTGSMRNLKPDILIENICKFSEFPYEKHKFHYKRIGLYGEDGNEL